MILDQLKPGKFKGVDFLFRSSAITGGRKTQKHEFPSSDKQTIEDFGLAPRSISLSISIAFPDYFSKRDSLLRVFEEGGAGILTHPFYGDLPNYVARNYTLNEDLTNLGEATFNVTFDKDDDNGLPKEELDVIGNIETSRQALSDSVSGNITSNFKVDNKFLNNFAEARLKLIDVQNTVREKTSFIFKIQEGVNEFNSLLSDFGNSVNEFITSPALLAENIISIFDNIDALYSNVKDSFDVYKRFSGFGSSDINLNINTVGLAQRKKNNDVINSSINALALGYQYQNAAKIEYDNVDDIEQTEAVIEANYQELINSDGMDDATVVALKDLRTVTSRFFVKEKLNADKITEISTVVQPARVLAYQYYEDSAVGERIVDLNSINDVTFVEGQIRVFTE